MLKGNEKERKKEREREKERERKELGQRGGDLAAPFLIFYSKAFFPLF